MKPVYVLVHSSTILGFHGNPYENFVVKIRELERIVREEEYFLVEGSPSLIPDGLPKESQIKVCGGLKEICVPAQVRSLREAGYNSSIYEPASI